MTSVFKVMEISSLMIISVVVVSSFPTPNIALIFYQDTVHTIGHSEFALNVVKCIIGAR